MYYCLVQSLKVFLLHSVTSPTLLHVVTLFSPKGESESCSSWLIWWVSQLATGAGCPLRWPREGKCRVSIWLVYLLCFPHMLFFFLASSCLWRQTFYRLLTLQGWAWEQLHEDIKWVFAQHCSSMLLCVWRWTFYHVTGHRSLKYSVKWRTKCSTVAVHHKMKMNTESTYL